MKYRDPDTGELKDIYVKASDTLPIGAEVDYNGTEVPSGWEEVDNPNDYSIDEKVVGKWIDNKPIYRKVIVHSFQSIESSSNYIDYQIAHNIDNLGQVINLRMFSSLNNYFPYVSMSGLWTVPVNVTAEYVILRHTDNWGSRKFIIILEYTKTTDSATTISNDEPTSEEATI